MVGWVVLLSRRLELTEETLRAQLDRIYPGEFLPPRQLGTFVVAGPEVGMQFLVKSAITGATGIFILHTVPGPYTAVSPFAKHIRDASLRRTAGAQRAWLGLELVGGGDELQAYRFIGKVLAALAPDDAVALVHPSRLVTYAFDAEIRQKLSVGELR
jgi:hypothetical protein